jgi:hypothetical protein
MARGAPKDISKFRRFFEEPRTPRHRMYEALRAYFVEGRLAKQVASAFGYSVGYFHVLCHHFRRDPAPAFFVAPRPGPRSRPKKSAALDSEGDLQTIPASDPQRFRHRQTRNCAMP